MLDIELLLVERGGPNASPEFPCLFVSYRPMSENSLWIMVPNSASPR